jgi:hypothetical protein
LIAAAQFSVSPSRSTSRPFVVVLQSNDFKRMPTRVVARLVLPGEISAFEGVHPRITPSLIVRGHVCILNPFDLATLGISRLGEVVASFADDEEAKHRCKMRWMLF